MTEFHYVGVEAQTRLSGNLLFGDTSQIGQIKVTLPGPANGAEIEATLLGNGPVGR